MRPLAVTKHTMSASREGLKPMKPTTTELLDALSLCARLFSRIDERSFDAIADEDVWGNLAKCAIAQLDDADHRDECALLATPPAYAVIEAAQNNLLTAGMPLAALPVESLYKQWTTAKGADLGGSKGLYLGDSALHIASVYQALGIEVPQAFAAMPDHLALMLELVILLLERGNVDAARQIAVDHLDWLDSYASVLAERAQSATDIRAFSEERRRDIQEGILFYRALVSLIARLLDQPWSSDRAGTPIAWNQEIREIDQMRKKEEMHA